MTCRAPQRALIQLRMETSACGNFPIRIRVEVALRHVIVRGATPGVEVVRQFTMAVRSIDGRSFNVAFDPFYTYFFLP